MSEPTKREMLEWTCKIHAAYPDDINIIYAIRRLIEHGPEVDEEFVEKWVRGVGMLECNHNKSVIKELLREAGVKVREAADE